MTQARARGQVLDSSCRGSAEVVPLTAPTARPAADRPDPGPAPSPGPSIPALLQGATEEAARLLGADGAFLYLLDPSSGMLRLTHDAGVSTIAPDSWMRRMELPVGVGMFGRAVADRRVVTTGDYERDASFIHAEGPDRLVTEIGIASVVVAPLVAGDEVFGALGTFSRARDAFTGPQVALVRALADHAALAIANARLIEELARSREAMARQAEVEKALRELGTRISAAREPEDVVQGTIDEALRLLRGDGARIDIVDATEARLRGLFTAGMEEIRPEEWPEDPDDRLEIGVSGRALLERRTVWTPDYLADASIVHGSGPDAYVRAKGIHAVIATPLIGEHGPFGTLTVWSTQPDLYAEPDAAMLEAIAGQAAVALGRAQLIEELARSRETLARRAEEERTLREIGARLAVIGRDPGVVLQRIVAEARRLLGAERGRLDLAEPLAGERRWLDPPDIVITDLTGFPDPDAADAPGLTGVAIRERRAVVSGDYLRDERFVHYPEADEESRELGLTSVIVVPVRGDAGLLGVLQAAHRRPDAFGPDEVRLVEALASQASIAITNARLVDRLASSQAALERTADAERALREIAGRIIAIRDPRDLLRDLAAEAARLLGSKASIIDLIDPATGGPSFTHEVGVSRATLDEWYARGLGDPATALAISGRVPITSDDYADDPRFNARGHKAFVRGAGVRSIAVAPLVADDTVLGALTVFTDEVGAYDATDAALLAGLADQAAIAVANSRLVEELGRSREALGRKADAEQALREIAGRLMRIQDPTALLQDVTDEAARLLGSSGAVIDLLDPATGDIAWAHDAGLDEPTREEWKVRTAGVGGVLLAIRERTVVVSADYAADPRFADAAEHAAFLTRAGIRSVMFAPLVGEAAVLGTLAVFSDRVGSFGPEDAALLGSLADLATLAIRNAELIHELDRAREDTARRAETERTLREIAARITAIRDPDAILGLIVDETRRVLGSDGAHLTRMAEDRTFVRPVVVAGGMDDATRDWLRSQAFPLEGGINGLAAAQGRVVWTPDYATDPRIPREPDDLEVAERMGLGAMAAAPLRAPGGEVIGTLAVSYRQTGTISAERLATLQALADHAAIALSNSDLLARLEASEGSYRRLVQATPDVIWRNDAEGRFTFIAEGSEALIGWRPDELVGQHFSVIVAPESMADAGEAWMRLATTPDAPWRLRFLLVRKDGTAFPAEVSAVSSFDDGVFTGGQGTLRDISERERLEREVRESEARFRSLVQSSPDLIFEMDGDGIYRFYSDRAGAVIGWGPDELIGRPFTEFVDMAQFPDAAERLAEIAARPGTPFTDRLVLRHKDGRGIPFEVSVVGATDETGRLIAIRGVARDVSERERLERELRASEARYRFLVENAPDIVFSADAHGRFVFVSDTIERLTGFRPDEIIGRGMDAIVTPETLAVATERWSQVAEDPTLAQVLRIELRRRDGGAVPVEIHSVGQVDGQGRFAGVHGSARDVSERERLEAELRESEERYRSVIQSSPDLIWATNRSGRYVFVSDRVRDLLGWQPGEVLGRPFRDFIDEASVEAANEEWARLAKEPGRTKTQRLGLRHRDGSIRPFEVSSVAVVREGEVQNVYGIARDIAERERLERELRESEERYRFLVENSPEIVYSIDEGGTFTYISESIERTLGWAPATFVGRHFRDLVAPRGDEPVGMKFAALARDPSQEITTVMNLRASDGTARPFDVSAVAIVRDGAFAGVHGSARDVSERERLEHELRESEERYRYLVQASPDLVWMTDDEGRFTFVSDQAATLLGWEPEALIGESFTTLSPPPLRRSAIARFRALQRRPTQVHRSRLTVLHQDGRELQMEITGIGMQADGRFLGAHGAARDVSERERLERDLRRQAAELAAGEERAHLARELHDSVTQALFSMTLLSRSIELLLQKDPAQVPDKLTALRELQREALAEMRALIFELRPGNIEENGLVTALRTHVASLSGRIGLPVVVEADLPERPSIEVEETLYRIAQEALHNVVKHANARQVRVEVARAGDRIRLRVTDDGRGFDPAAVPDGHLGLAGMRSRAERLGGELAVRSGVGSGTVIEVSVPDRARETAGDDDAGAPGDPGGASRDI